MGAGIGGASLAHALLQRAPRLKLALLEAESRPGYHTTGRSAAFYAETYGGPGVQPLSSASKAFLQRPPAGFCETPILSPRGALHICRAGQTLEALEAEFRQGGIACEHLHGEDILRKAPRLRAQWAEAAIWEPGCSDIDVAGLHQSYLRSARRAGADLVTDARAAAVAQRGDWRILTPAGEFRAGALVNAAGAWADEVAALAGVAPIGIEPLRRTILVAEVQPEAPTGLPLVIDSGGSLYFKPDAGRLWISPHDETPDVPRDVQPEEMDVAVALDRFERMCDWPVRRILSSWAGLRSFAPDRLPVLGPDPEAPGFHWCAGQGGWGIQTAPAASAGAAAMLLGEAPPAAYAGIDAAPYLPARFR
nr:FAD-binding oxidoreductase [Sandaracinobacteroides sayramensis]